MHSVVHAASQPIRCDSSLSCYPLLPIPFCRIGLTNGDEFAGPLQFLQMPSLPALSIAADGRIQPPTVLRAICLLPLGFLDVVPVTARAVSVQAIPMGVYDQHEEERVNMAFEAVVPRTTGTSTRS